MGQAKKVRTFVEVADRGTKGKNNAWLPRANVSVLAIREIFIFYFQVFNTKLLVPARSTET